MKLESCNYQKPSSREQASQKKKVNVLENKILTLESEEKLGKAHHLIVNVFINENFTVKNNEIAFVGRKLKRSGNLNKIHTRDGTVHVSSTEIHRGKVLIF